MTRRTLIKSALGAGLAVALAQSPVALAQQAPIRIGVPTAIQLQVGRDTQEAVQMAIDEINAKGGVLGRKLEMVVADETEKPEAGINAIKKLTAEDKVDVLIGGYTSGVTLAQLPHISRAKTIYLGVGAASPAITAKVKTDYDNYKYVFRVGPVNAADQARQLTGFLSDFIGGELGFQKVADPTPGKNRVHIDLAATVELEDEIARLIEAGAEEIARHNFEHSGWVVMSDPEGNFFCVSQH